MMHNLRSTDFYQGIERAIKHRLEVCDGNLCEAEEAAWDDRKFALKRFIMDNKEEMEEYLFNKEEEDE
ncbi:MAG: hypothetical protein GY738_04715 [Pseudoalteromonas sp.]|nr:hypothetical protein [Pseudoalteromonas sp.]